MATATEEADMYTHILIATDGSELAAKAVAAGLSLAKALAAGVTCINASEPWTAMVGAEGAAFSFPVGRD
jgi:nucleotide-binding universal stress UspA family protein